MLVAEPGSKVWVNGSEVNSMPLKALRKQLSIIPQTSFLFIGSVRENLDPFG
jgi:ATP-binding cassette subfamily C (CFTR/MRP) protein 10